MRKLTGVVIILAFFISPASMVFAEDLSDLPPTLEEVDEICLINFHTTMDLCQWYVKRCLVVIGGDIGEQKKACAENLRLCVNAAVMEFSRCRTFGPMPLSTEN